MLSKGPGAWKFLVTIPRKIISEDMDKEVDFEMEI